MSKKMSSVEPEVVQSDQPPGYQEPGPPQPGYQQPGPSQPGYQQQPMQPQMMQPQMMQPQMMQPQIMQPMTTVVINNQPTQPENSLRVGTRNGTRDWTSGLCGCCEDIGSCCMTIWCSGASTCALSIRVGDGFCMPFCVPDALLALRVRVRGLGDVKLVVAVSREVERAFKQALACVIC
ncbi:uncharacterized protein LOC127852614 [Dreissena polymorpha]|uniref:Uncharacterized protein n=1 Tax=Dreissena polymorpha TaxID=45954 RepID=A0A9D4HRT3_DREPO|nr:uncharacterized protein LOC127852614 [Dreissena polymorpha]KAH3728726.1 hypothetical protein DPMN_054687 [Dreissena polymorpha]